MPPSNPTVEPEMKALLDPASVIVDCFDPRSDLDLPDRLVAYRQGSQPAATRLAAAGAAAIGVACTGSSYPVGIEGDGSWRALLAESTGLPVHTAASATFDLLTAIGATAITIVSPYPDWLTEQCANFWRSAGFGVLGVHAIENGDAIYATSTDAMDAAVATAFGDFDETDRNIAIFVAGSGAASLASIEAVTAPAVPILSSNVALAWALHRSVPLSEPALLRRFLDRWPTTTRTTLWT
ncbi:MAG: hypothetical protein ABIQ39_12830 [Ilumatobacteraceae bacterium]